MGIIFRKNSSRNEKAYTLFMLTMMGCAIYGLLSDFHPKAITYSLPVWIGILPLSFLLLSPWFFDSNPANKTLIYGPIKKSLWYLGVYCLYVLFSFGFICMFLPSVYTSAFGEPFEEHAKVTRKSDVYRRRGCDIRMYTDLFKGRVCITSHFYSSIEVGDQILVKGLETRLGYKLSNVKRADQLTSNGSR